MNNNMLNVQTLAKGNFQKMPMLSWVHNEGDQVVVAI